MTDRSGTVGKPGISARLVFHPERGDIWQARCEHCTWTSRDLPFRTKGEALHTGNLHTVMCRKQPATSGR